MENKIRGILPCAEVKAPGYGDRRKALSTILTEATLTEIPELKPEIDRMMGEP